MTRDFSLVLTRDLLYRPCTEILSGHNDSDLTCPKCQEDCASVLKTGTAPQRERSDTPKVTRGLPERSQNEHCATTRANRHTQSEERVARARVTFSENAAHSTKHDHHCKCENVGIRHLFVAVSEALRLPRNMILRHPKNCACHA